MLNTLMLSGILDISQAPETKKQLLERLASDAEPLTVNLGAVLGVDTAIIQLLVAAKVQYPKTKIVECSDDLLEQFDRIGVMRLLV
jgi:anti-anti-sigma regulatory factor